MAHKHLSIPAKVVTDLVRDLTNSSNVLRDEQGYKIEKVKRDVSGSYAITYFGKKSNCQYNAETVKYFLKMSASEFIEYAKTVI